MPTDPHFQPETCFLELGEGFADRVEAADFPKHILRWRHDRAADEIGLKGLTDEEWITHFGRFEPLPGSLPNPLAQRYHGHQFRHYNPDIGDGRGFLFAQMRDRAGRLMDLGTKGSGTTPYSRSGDGRLTLKGGVREIMASEMLGALGAYTSRTLSLIETGEALQRGDEPSPTRSAVMVRLCHGHIRIGTFQRHAYFSDRPRLEALTAYCLKHYFGQAASSNAADNAVKLVSLVGEKTAEQAADLIATGYVHGVLNSDNINITGEIFDFGPWRLLPETRMDFTAAYFDETGLYAYGRQPDAIHWNLYQLAGALLDIAGEDAMRGALAPWPKLYAQALIPRQLKRLGLKPGSRGADEAFLNAVQAFLTQEAFPFERFFFDWFGGQASRERAAESPFAAAYAKPEYSDFFAALSARAPANPAALDHPYFLGDQPCTLLIDEVETIWAAIDQRNNWKPLYEKMKQARQMADALAL